MTVPADLTENDRAFIYELEHLINRFNQEARSNTPDFILAEYLFACLRAFEEGVRERETWYGHAHQPGQDARDPAVKERL